MSIEIKYAGTQQRWPELSITGKQSVWMPGQIEERDDVEAGKLLATGLFTSEPVDVKARISAQGIASLESSGGKATQRQLAAMRRRTQAEFAKAPLIQAPARADTTAYGIGRKARHTNGQLMICVAAGTTGTGAPTWDAAQPMADGTVTWWAFGAASRVNADGYPVPTVSVGTSITGLVETQIWGNGAKFSQPTCPNVVRSGDLQATRAWTFLHGAATDYGAGPGYHGYLRVVEFVSDAPKIAIGTYNSSGLQIRVTVDGYMLEDDPTPFPAGNPAYYTIDWPAGRKIRSYRIELAGAAQSLRSVCVDAQSFIAPAESVGTKGVWLSDSYGITVAGYICPTREAVSERVMKRVGIRHTRNMVLAGTGYVATNGGVNYAAPVLLSANPQAGWEAHLVVAAYGYNEIGSDVTTVSTAASGAWATLRQQYPLAVIFVVGPWPGNTGPSANAIALDAALASAAAAMGDINLEYISPIGDPSGPWISGTGKSSALSGVGNADYYIGSDNAHPTYTGAAYIEMRLADEIDARLRARNC